MPCNRVCRLEEEEERDGGDGGGLGGGEGDGEEEEGLHEGGSWILLDLHCRLVRVVEREKNGPSGDDAHIRSFRRPSFSIYGMARKLKRR